MEEWHKITIILKKNEGMTHLLHKQTTHIKEKSIFNAPLITLEICHNFESFKERLQRAIKPELVKVRAVWWGLLCAHETHFLFLLCTQPDYISQPPLQLALARCRILTHSLRENVFLLHQVFKKRVCLPHSLFPTAGMHMLVNQEEGVKMATFHFIPDYLKAEVYFPTQILRLKSLVVLMLKWEILIGNIVWIFYVRS